MEIAHSVSRAGWSSVEEMGGACSTTSLLCGLSVVTQSMVVRQNTSVCLFYAQVKLFLLNSYQWNSWSISQYIHLKKIHSIKSDYYGI